MSLVNLCGMLQAAEEGGYAVPSFNVSTLETLKGIVQAAEEARSPLIVAITPKFLDYFGPEYFCPMAVNVLRQASVPVALHLDHGRTLADVMTAIRGGFTSVMIDGSAHSFEENVALTKLVVELAKPLGVSVEGELGRLILADGSMGENSADNMTDPKMAGEFARQTGVDALAVSVGNAHGVYAKKPEIDVDRLIAIRAATDSGTALVLHGGSGTPRIPELIQNGIRKININADFQIAYRTAISQVLQLHPGENLYSDDLLVGAIDAIRQVGIERIRDFGSDGRA